MIADPSSFGWMLDGVCDGFGDFFRFIAFVIFLSKVWPVKKVIKVGGYDLLESEGGMLHHLWRPLLVVGMVGLQTLFSSIIWNYFMINYHFLLEVDLIPGSYDLAVATKQNEILKSSGMWMVRNTYVWSVHQGGTKPGILVMGLPANQEFGSQNGWLGLRHFQILAAKLDASPAS